MPNVVGIRFKRGGKVYYFNPADLPLKVGDTVVVETTRGPELGWVVIASEQVEESDLEEPLKRVLRLATEEDRRQQNEFQVKTTEALAKCAEKVAQFNLPMKLLAAEYNLDGSRLTFFFSAEGRVDFRELVRELASTFRTHIELRQVGPRDEAKLLGGYGHCGRPLCCTSYLCDFKAVSIRMAKEQGLLLNPAKISGICGRLLCCLSYESEFYAQAKEAMPKVGKEVPTPMGLGKVVAQNVLKGTVLVQLESEATVELPVTDLSPEVEESPPLPRESKHRRRSRGRRQQPLEVEGEALEPLSTDQKGNP